MLTYRIDTVVKEDGKISIKELPFSTGEEVIIHLQEEGSKSKKVYSLRGKPFRYIDPFENVAEEDWDTFT